MLGSIAVKINIKAASHNVPSHIPHVSYCHFGRVFPQVPGCTCQPHAHNPKAV